MADRFERLTNLVAVLLDTRRPLALEEIVERVPGYPDEKESARRQFERDKDALRGLNIPLDLVEAALGDFQGYRIDPRKYELPELDLTAEERAALHAAVSAMSLEGGEGREALWKLGGLDREETPTLGALPSVPALPVLMDASRRRAPVTFGYRGERRHLHPYAVMFRRGNWYVTGHDTDRDETRSFRADRIEGEVQLEEADGAFERPDDFDLEGLLHDEPWRYGDEPPLEATVRVDAVVAGWVVQRLGAGPERPRRAGDTGTVVKQRADGGVVVRLTVTNREAFRSFVLGLLDHAVVLKPPELRDDLVSWLREIAGQGPSGPTERKKQGPSGPTERKKQRR